MRPWRWNRSSPTAYGCREAGLSSPLATQLNTRIECRAEHQGKDTDVDRDHERRIAGSEPTGDGADHERRKADSGSEAQRWKGKPEEKSDSAGRLHRADEPPTAGDSPN